MRIFLDVDEVVASFLGGIEKHYPEFKKETQIEYELPAHIDWKKFHNDMPFWLGLPVLDRPTVPIAGYISHRPFETFITEFWLHMNRFPRTPVYHVANSHEKAELLKTLDADLYVDDKPSTYIECTNAGIKTLLYTQPWNLFIQTGERISKLQELEKWYNL